MQNRNFVWFMVFSFLTLVAWVWMQNLIWPPPVKKPAEKIAQKLDWAKLLREYPPAARAVSLIGNSAVPLAGLPDEARLVQEIRTFTPPIPPPVEVAKEKEKVPEPEADVIAFGGEKFYLQGAFTTRGAGVVKLTLNKFKAANYLGEPTNEPLELIPEDPEFPSFLMYHYPARPSPNWGDSPLPDLGRRVWKLESKKEGPDGQVFRFSTDVPDASYKHLQIIKTYKLGPRDYHFTLTIEIQDRSTAGTTEATPFRYQLMGAHGLPIEGVWYTGTYRDAVIGMVDSGGSLVRFKEEAVRISTKLGGHPYPEPSIGAGNELLQYAGVVTQYFGSVIVVDNEQPPEADGGVNMKKILRWARPTLESIETRGILKDFDEKYVHVADSTGREWSYVLLPRVARVIKEAELTKGSPVVISFYQADKNGRVATWIRRGDSPRGFLDDITIRVNSQPIELKPGQKVAHQFLLYHGPVKTQLLDQFSGNDAVNPDLVNRYTNKLHLRTLTDYGRFGWWTDLLIVVTRFMHWLLYKLHFLCFGNFGLTIILLTVIVRGVMFPISRKQAYFSIKMQELAPEMKKIKEKYPNDRKAQVEASQELYRKHGVNPLGSCLPLLMQMPIFLGLYYSLQESIHFRLARFLWIDNLAAPDMLVWWTEKIPYISDPDNLGGFLYLGPFFNLLPLFAVTLMIVQQKIMTPPPQDEQQEMQQKMMKYMMIFFGIMFYKVASGLCIYFIASSLWGLAERRFLPKKKPAAPATAQATPPGKPGPVPIKAKGSAGRGKKEEKSNGKMQKLKDWWAEVLKEAKKK